MVVCSGVRAADDHDGGITLEQTVIANRGFEKMTVLLKPFELVPKISYFSTILVG
jgi:hypothetical protein